MADEDKILIEAQITDNRAKLLKLREREGVKMNPFLLVGSIFFSALIAVVVMMFIIIFLVLKEGFSRMGPLS